MAPLPRFLFAAPIPAILGAAGCSAPAAALATPPEYAPTGQAKCGIVKNQAEPLIIEWPAAQRTKLEALAKRRAVAVRYGGCDLEVLAQCQVPKSYTYTSTTRQRERVTIHNEDELYARLPIGALQLEGNLKKAGELNVSMTIVGTYETDRATVHSDELTGECDGVTHIVTALTVGSFEFIAGADVEGGAGATVAGVGAGARGGSRRETLDQAGDQASCERATAEDQAPPYGCGALLRIEVIPIVERHAAPAAPIAAHVEPPASIPGEGAPIATHVEPSPAANPPQSEPPPLPSPTASRLPAASQPLSPMEEPPPPAPVPGGTSLTPYVVGGVILAALIAAGVIIGVVVAGNQKDAEMTPPNENPVSYRPVLRW